MEVMMLYGLNFNIKLYVTGLRSGVFGLIKFDYILFQTFTINNFLGMAIKFSTLIKLLLGYILQVTECKYSDPLL